MFVQNIDCGYTLESPCRGGSYEYPQSMSWIRNKKKVSYIKVGCMGVFIAQTCFPDDVHLLLIQILMESFSVIVKELNSGRDLFV